MYEDFFAKRLAHLRLKRNISAREMSLSIGQNSSYINRIENGMTFPKMQVFFYICEYLNITPQEFFDEQNDNPEQIRTIEEDLKQLTDEQRQNIVDIIATFKKGNKA